MFTGIIERKGRIERPGRKLSVQTGWRDLKRGESVAVNGVCLTVVRTKGNVADFDLVQETLKRTTLGTLKKKDEVNLERAIRARDRLSGHIVQGHVDGTGNVLRGGVSLKIQSPLAAQMVPKGSVTIDGVSLTLVDVDEDTLTIALIPTTREITTLGKVKKGGRVNIELDILVKYAAKKKASTITWAFLRKAGF